MWEPKRTVNARLDKSEPTIHTEVLQGDLMAATKIKIEYANENVLCLERLTLEANDKAIKYNVIQVTQYFWF